MKLLFVDVQHGLGNRLRALASGAAIAKRTGRDLVVVWRPDDHCEARIGDVLDYSGAVIEDDSYKAYRSRAKHKLTCMEDEPNSRFQKAILDNPKNALEGDVYVKTAYALLGPYHDYRLEQQTLRSLRPAAAVLGLLTGVRTKNAVGVHIRSASGEGYEHLPYEAPKNWPAHRHRELVRWRKLSGVERFIKKVDALVSEGRADTVFLAADTADAYAAFKARFGKRIASIDRSVFDRSARQIQYGLADMMCLARAESLLGSSWSSFTEVAQRLAARGRPIAFSGKDF